MSDHTGSTDMSGTDAGGRDAGSADTNGGGTHGDAGSAETVGAGSGDAGGNRTRAGNIPAIERATRRPWAEWIEFFESRGARGLGHAEIARLALAEMPADLENEGWWAQGAAIAYEQHAGLRVPGQSSAGDFRVGASRTLAGDRDAVLAAWIAAFGDRSEHLGHAVEGVRASRTEKRSFRRFSLDGAGRVEVSATPKDDAKTVLAVSQTGLADGDRIEEWRAYWKARLAEL